MGIINDNKDNPHSSSRIITKITNNRNSYSKKEIDDKLLTKSNKGDTILRDGSNTMSGNLDLNNNIIQNHGNATLSHHVLNKSHLDTALNLKVNTTNAVLRDGSNNITGDIDLNNHEIKNLKFQPSNDLRLFKSICL